jgi:16S rRNA (guanine(966)-N(2))-methyltransferase RsmD
MRVIAGKYRSRRLQSLPGMDLRPTADRLRETLFDVLTAGDPCALEGTVWIDLYAGTGAVGIEALSRGASIVYFAELSSRATTLINKNLEALKIEAGASVLKQDAVRALRDLDARGIHADFIFLDPPYRMEEAYRRTLEAVSELGVLKAGGIIIAEHVKRFDPGERFGSMCRYRKLAQGDAALSFYRIS